MSQPLTQFVIPGLDRLDRLSLAGQFQPDEIQFEDIHATADRFSEPVTAAVVICTLATIRAIAAYFLRGQHKGKVRRTLIVRHPDGSMREETVEVDLDVSRSPNADVVKQLGTYSGTDVSSLLKEEQ